MLSPSIGLIPHRVNGCLTSKDWHLKPAGDNRQRSCYQDVNLREKLVHLLLQNSADALRRNEISGADLFMM